MFEINKLKTKKVTGYGPDSMPYLPTIHTNELKINAPAPLCHAYILYYCCDDDDDDDFCV